MPVRDGQKNMKHWAPLKKGDLVDLIAPGFACREEELRAAVQFLESWGLRVRVPKNIFSSRGLCSHRDDVRWSHLQKALLATDSQAVWCLRGGYGSIRLIPNLTQLKAPKSRRAKLFIGLSDITSLHVFLNQSWRWPTIHGPLLDRLGMGKAKPKYVRELKRLVFGETPTIEFSNLKALNDFAKKNKIIRAPVSGGNLITLQSSLKTKAEWDARGKILFFEDIGERGYRVDRVLEQFYQMGVFASASAVIFGDFTGGNESDGRNHIAMVLREFAKKISIPALTGLPSGHGLIQRPLPLATPSELFLKDGRGKLISDTGVEPIL